MYLQVIYYPKKYFAIILSSTDSDSALFVLYLARYGLNISPPLASLFLIALCLLVAGVAAMCFKYE